MRVINEIRQEINKKRWEGWRAKQNKEREKTYCYWGNWGNWSEWSDCCEDIDASSNMCAQASLKATLYAGGGCRIKVHYAGTCCAAGPECGYCICRCHLRTRICTTEAVDGGYCRQWKVEEFGYYVCNASGDHWFDIEPDYEGYEHEAFLEVSCCCAGLSAEAHASCKVWKGT